MAVTTQPMDALAAVYRIRVGGIERGRARTAGHETQPFSATRRHPADELEGVKQRTEIEIKLCSSQAETIPRVIALTLKQNAINVPHCTYVLRLPV